MCPIDQMCQDRLVQDDDDPEPKSTIACIDRATGHDHLSPNQQSGVYTIGNPDNLNAAQTIMSVTLEVNLADATVAALMEGTY
jgi:hypothetical protein